MVDFNPVHLPLPKISINQLKALLVPVASAKSLANVILSRNNILYTFTVNFHTASKTSLVKLHLGGAVENRQIEAMVATFLNTDNDALTFH